MAIMSSVGVVSGGGGVSRRSNESSATTTTTPLPAVPRCHLKGCIMMIICRQNGHSILTVFTAACAVLLQEMKNG